MSNATIAPPRTEHDVRITMISKAKVEKWYKLIAAGVAQAYGDAADDVLVTNIMADIVAERLQVWVLWAEGEPRKFMGVLTTSIVRDRWDQKKTLCVNTLANFGRADRSAWFMGLAAVEAFARRNQCVRMQFDATNPKVVRMAVRLGFQAVSTRCLKEV